MRWVFAILCVLGTSARADTVGVVVSGETAIQARLKADATRWIAQHSLTLAPDALDAASITTLLDCLTIDDTVCASAVVAKKAHAEVILAISAEAAQSGGKRDITIHAHWMRKGHNAGSVRRVCEACTEAALDATLDAVISDLTRMAVTGHLTLRSKPSGLVAMLDNQPIGSTPLEHDVGVGQHQLAFVQDGKTVGERSITIAANQTTELEVPLGAPRAGGGHSRTIPALVIGAGVATVIAGSVLLATSERSTGVRPTYRDTRPAGFGLAIGGGVLVGVGVFLLLRTDHHAGPTVDVASEHVSAGWMGRF